MECLNIHTAYVQTSNILSNNAQHPITEITGYYTTCHAKTLPTEIAKELH